jgi:hypothetical protein
MLAIRVAQGDWGDAQPTDIEAAAHSTAASFPAFNDDESIAIVLESTSGVPRTVWSKSELGEFVVRLNVRGTLWARLAFQFAHEFCHVLAGPRSFRTAGLRGSRRRSVRPPRYLPFVP